eukprot:scaffold81854_cov33-Tisochrysis_lutea.AAC.1
MKCRALVSVINATIALAADRRVGWAEKHELAPSCRTYSPSGGGRAICLTCAAFLTRQCSTSERSRREQTSGAGRAVGTKRRRERAPRPPSTETYALPSGIHAHGRSCLLRYGSTPLHHLQNARRVPDVHPRQRRPFPLPNASSSSPHGGHQHLLHCPRRPIEQEEPAVEAVYAASAGMPSGRHPLLPTRHRLQPQHC